MMPNVFFSILIIVPTMIYIFLLNLQFAYIRINIKIIKLSIFKLFLMRKKFDRI